MGYETWFDDAVKGKQHSERQPSTFDLWLSKVLKENPSLAKTQWYLSYICKYGYYDPKTRRMAPADEMARQLLERQTQAA